MDGKILRPLPGGDTAPAVARRYVREVGAAWATDLLESVLLVTSELVTNAVRHGAGEVTLVVRTSTQTIRVEVCDGGVEPVPQPAGDPIHGAAHGAGGDGGDRRDGADRRDSRQVSEGGRGLYIVDAVAGRWGVTYAHEPPGKVVWFEMGPSS